MFRYKPLLKLMIDRGLKKQDLVNKGVLSWATMAKINKDENVSLEIIGNICSYLNCQPGDIIEYVPDLTPNSTANPILLDIRVLKIATIQSKLPMQFTSEDAVNYLRKHKSYKEDGSFSFNYDSENFVDFVDEQLSIASLFEDEKIYFKLKYNKDSKKYYFDD